MNRWTVIIFHPLLREGAHAFIDSIKQALRYVMSLSFTALLWVLTLHLFVWLADQGLRGRWAVSITGRGCLVIVPHRSPSNSPSVSTERYSEGICIWRDECLLCNEGEGYNHLFHLNLLKASLWWTLFYRWAEWEPKMRPKKHVARS